MDKRSSGRYFKVQVYHVVIAGLAKPRRVSVAPHLAVDRFRTAQHASGQLFSAASADPDLSRQEMHRQVIDKPPVNLEADNIGKVNQGERALTQMLPSVEPYQNSFLLFSSPHTDNSPSTQLCRLSGTQNYP